LVLVCDLDGVVVDFDRGWCERRGIEPGQVQEWDELHILAGLDSPAEFWRWFQESGGFAGLPLFPQAKAALELAAHRGWFIVYATNRPDWALHQTQQDLILHGLPQAHHLTFTPRKWGVQGDLYLEDAPANIMAMWSMGCRVVPVWQPWNHRLLANLPIDDWLESLTPHSLRPWLEAIEELTDRAGVG
jgi:hypothetical protein